MRKDKVLFDAAAGNRKDTKVKVKRFNLGFLNRMREKWLKRYTDNIMIEMHHLNGSISNIVLLKDKHKFIYGGNAYIIDEDRKIWNNSSRTYMLRYHEGFALPFEIQISGNTLKKSVRGNNDNKISQIETSFNPYVLRDVLKFEYAKGVIQGAEVSEMIKRAYFLIIITLCGVLAHLIINAVKSGWF